MQFRLKASLIKAAKDGALLSLFMIFMISCSGTSTNWQGESAIGSPTSLNSSRLYLAPTNEFSGLELEFVQMRDGLRLYLNVYGLEIPPDAEDSCTSRVYFSFKDHAYHCAAARFLGGQRLLIPEYVQLEMVEYLQAGQSVFIQVGRYQANVYPEQFVSLFQAMIGARL
ncbi:MAG: hypothetical protein H0T62_14715 [Parachlamydiaceae bacterium]|nr:hypothetical protein [Parachlamydiaceae bacterium]